MKSTKAASSPFIIKVMGLDTNFSNQFRITLYKNLFTNRLTNGISHLIKVSYNQQYYRDDIPLHFTLYGIKSLEMIKFEASNRCKPQTQHNTIYTFSQQYACLNLVMKNPLSNSGFFMCTDAL